LSLALTRSFSVEGIMFAGIVLTGSVGVLAIVSAVVLFANDTLPAWVVELELSIIWLGMLVLVASAIQSARLMSEREEMATELRGLIATHKAFKREREHCLAAVRGRRAGLLDRGLMKVVAAVDCDLAETVAKIGRVSDRLVQIAATGQAPAGDQ
jgi:hypothetical protein